MVGMCLRDDRKNVGICSSLGAMQGEGVREE